jgi:hypothetical protein
MVDSDSSDITGLVFDNDTMGQLLHIGSLSELKSIALDVIDANMNLNLSHPIFNQETPTGESIQPQFDAEDVSTLNYFEQIYILALDIENKSRTDLLSSLFVEVPVSEYSYNIQDSELSIVFGIDYMNLLS